MESIRDLQRWKVEQAFMKELSSDDPGKVVELLKKYGKGILTRVESTLRHLFNERKFAKIEDLTAICLDNGIQSIMIVAYNTIAQHQLRPVVKVRGKDYPEVIEALRKEECFYAALENIHCVEMIRIGIKAIQTQMEAENEIQQIFMLRTPSAFSKSHRELPTFVPGRPFSPVPIRASSPSLGFQPVQLYQEEQTEDK